MPDGIVVAYGEVRTVEDFAALFDRVFREGARQGIPIGDAAVVEAHLLAAAADGFFTVHGEPNERERLVAAVEFLRELAKTAQPHVPERAPWGGRSIAAGKAVGDLMLHAWHAERRPEALKLIELALEGAYAQGVLDGKQPEQGAAP
jgi:hypothetical protein